MAYTFDNLDKPEELPSSPWKKYLAVGLLVLLLLGAAGGGIYWWVFLRSAPNVARYLPADTLFLARIPNPPATWLKYDQSNLKKVLESDEIKGVFGYLTFLFTRELKEKQLSEEVKRWQEIAGLLGEAFNGEAFIAFPQAGWTKANPVNVLAGMKPTLNAPKFEEFIQKTIAEFKKIWPELQAGSGQAGGVTYEWAEIQPGQPRICYAKIKGWYVVSVGESAVQDFLNRVAGSVPLETSLEKNEAYHQVLRQLGGKVDGYAYINTGLVLKGLVGLMAKEYPAQQTDLMMLVKQYAGLNVVGAGATFEGVDLKDHWVVAWPKAQRPPTGAYEVCEYKTLSATSKDTLIYSGQNLDWTAMYDYLLKSYQEGQPQMAQMLNSLEARAALVGLDLKKNVLGPLGPELSFQLDWPAEAPFPSGGMMVEIKNRPDFEPTAEWLIRSGKLAAAAYGGAAQSAIDKNVLLTIKIPTMPAWSPTLVVGEKYLGLFATETGAKRLVVPPAPIETLPYDDTFKLLAESRQSGSCSMIYCHTPRLVQKTYAATKPFLPLFLANLKEKNPLKGRPLPEALTFIDWAGPTLLVTRSSDDWIEAEAISGVGNQFVPLVTAGIISAGWNSYSQQQASQAAGIAQSEGASAENIRADLQELRVVVESWIAAEAVPTGTEVTWEKVKPFMVPGSRLEASSGLDRLGHPYLLGKAKEQEPDVAPQTKEKFAVEKDLQYWRDHPVPVPPPVPLPSATPPPPPAPPQ
jgi:hypothetical protein